MDSREQFEKWYAGSWGEAGDEPLNSFNRDERGQYTDTYVHDFWVVWQGSREAVEIELPVVKDLEIVGIGCTYEDSFVDYLEVVRAIEDAGLKVKPC